jgi:chromosome segregation ATPase
MKTITLPFEEYEELLQKVKPYVEAEEKIESLLNDKKYLARISESYKNDYMEEQLKTGYYSNQCNNLREEINVLNKRKWYHLLFKRV